MKIFTVLGGGLGLYYSFSDILHMRITLDITIFYQLFKWNGFFRHVIAMFIASLTLLVTFKPNDPFPWHWALIFIFSILLAFLCNLIVGGLIFVGGIIGLVKYL
ncbi:MAG: hypothetical protein ACFFCI_04590 [Promethearchaeota archaeon]